MVERQPAYGGGKVDMQIAFKVSAESVYCQVNPGNETLLCGLCFDNFSGDRSDFIDEMSIVPKNVPEHIRHGEGDVLPTGLRQSLVCILHPDIGRFFATGRAKSTFACETTGSLERAKNTAKESIAQSRSPTSQHFQHVFDNGRSDNGPISEKEFPPISIIKENVL